MINEDRLGLDQVYVQAKRYRDHPIRLPDIQAFVGALEGKRAQKGVFITASKLHARSQKYVDRRFNRRVVLIDGDRLAELMIRFGVGVTTRDTFRVQEVDEDFFMLELG